MFFLDLAMSASLVVLAFFRVVVVMLSLFVVFVLINQFDMSGAWYFVAFVLWVSDVIFRTVIASAVSRYSIEKVISSTPGVRGLVGK